jgi:hypothetical protein
MKKTVTNIETISDDDNDYEAKCGDEATRTGIKKFKAKLKILKAQTKELKETTGKKSTASQSEYEGLKDLIAAKKLELKLLGDQKNSDSNMSDLESLSLGKTFESGTNFASNAHKLIEESRSNSGFVTKLITCLQDSSGGVGKSAVNKFYQTLLLYHIGIDNELRPQLAHQLAKNKVLIAKLFEEVTSKEPPLYFEEAKNNPMFENLAGNLFLLITEFFVLIERTKLPLFLDIIDRFKEKLISLPKGNNLLYEKISIASIGEDFEYYDPREDPGGQGLLSGRLSGRGLLQNKEITSINIPQKNFMTPGHGFPWYENSFGSSLGSSHRGRSSGF